MVQTVKKTGAATTFLRPGEGTVKVEVDLISLGSYLFFLLSRHFKTDYHEVAGRCIRNLNL